VGDGALLLTFFKARQGEIEMSMAWTEIRKSSKKFGLKTSSTSLLPWPKCQGSLMLKTFFFFNFSRITIGSVIVKTGIPY
jgi:hypothetical protein